MPFLHAHNALAGQHYGQPWPAVNYRLARKVRWLEARSPDMSVEQQVVSPLRVSFDYFRDNADLARLILIEGPPVDAEPEEPGLRV